MTNELRNTPTDDIQKLPLYRLQLLVKTFGHNYFVTPTWYALAIVAFLLLIVY